MSDYLVQRIATSRKITVYPETEITQLDGDRYLRQVASLAKRVVDDN